MRFWITRNSELPIREQLVRQVLLGILSEDLPAGHKLPSVRAIARRHQIHSNTVSAAFHDLLEQGWLELRRGSGLYVRPMHPSSGASGELDRLLAKLLQEARVQGYEPEEVLDRLGHLLRPRSYERILIAEPEPAMREILQAELGERLTVPIEFVEASDFSDVSKFSKGLVVALPTRAAKVRHRLPPGVLCIPLRLRSVPATLEGQPKPPPNTILSIVSRSAEIRHWARAMLIAVGLDPECLHDVDAASEGWRDRLSLTALAVTDILCARELPAGCPARVFRVIADSSIEDLKQFCGA
ncbi:MAG TPA: GntR family transcriptional regulator [Bryobacteraceae bacterium]|nr:GntR family transcriptional regulator [Bryobacteraceae bacterium]